MKILLLGEFSAFHKNLAEGLRAIGEDVTTASNGDAWKKIPSDINWGSSRGGVPGKLEKILNLTQMYKKLEGYDVVQLMSPVIFPKQLGINKSLISHIKQNNSKMYLVGAGGTMENTAIANFFKHKYKYPQLYNEIFKRMKHEWSLETSGIRFNEYLLDSIDGYIPIMYEYAQGYRNINYKKLRDTIPIPMNIDDIKYEENSPKDKVVFYHGVTREGEKGTPLIREAMLELKRRYPRDVEINIVGNLPLSEYLDVTRRSNVIIDQVYSSSYGMNTVYNLAMGKVCIGGGEKECLREFGIESSPLIPIDTNSHDIFKKMEMILENKKNISKIGLESRLYAESIHSHRKVAKQYLKAWKLSNE